MSQESHPGDGDTSTPDETTANEPDLETDPVTLRAQRDLLREENERLRTEFERLRQSQYRRVAAGLAGVGTVALLGAVVYPAIRQVLLVLAAIGGFGAVLTYYLTPGRFVSASVGREVYQTYAENLTAMRGELGLTDTRVYYPQPQPTVSRLYIPQQEEYTLPAPEAAESTFIIGDDASTRGVMLTPTGVELYTEFRNTVTGEPAPEPGPLVTQVGEALVEAFEIADAVVTDTNSGAGRVTAEVTGDVFAGEYRTDTPVVSTLGVALADVTDRPVTVETAPDGDTYTVSYYWDPEQEPLSETSDGQI